jgi:site-specific recombinase XerD
MQNPVKRNYNLRLAKPLPRYLREEQVLRLFTQIESGRDRAIFTLMLRCGLRVEEVANLTLAAVDLPRAQLFIYAGKGGKDRVVYLSSDALKMLSRYLKKRPSSRAKKVFLVEKGTYKDKPLSVRGIQKRMEYYANKAGLKVSCHQLRHTMATQLLNADADLVIIQDLLGHSQIRTTQRYCKVSNLKVQRDYHKAIGKVMQRHGL